MNRFPAQGYRSLTVRDQFRGYSLTQGCDVLRAGAGLAEAREDVGDGEVVGVGVEAGHRVGDVDRAIAVLVRGPAGGLHPEIGRDAAENDVAAAK